MTKNTPTPEEILTQDDKKLPSGTISTWSLMETTRERTQKGLDGGKERTIEQSPETPRRIKICLVRHYPYIKNKDYLTYRPLLARKNAKKAMSEEEEDMIKKLSKEIKVFSDFKDISPWLQKSLTRIFSHPQNTLILCDHDWVDPSWAKHTETRMITTEKSLKKQFPWVHSLRTHLPKSNKNEEFIDNQARLMRILGNTLSRLATTTLSEIDTIVIVSNRSYVDAFSKAGVSKDPSMTLATEFFEETGFISYDFELTSKKDESWKKDVPVLRVPTDSRDATEYKFDALQKAQSIQNNSLEHILYGDQAWPVLERQIYFMEEDKQQENQPSWSQDWKEKKYHKRYVPLDQLFDINLPTQEGKTSRKFVLPAHVGNGKSFVMAEVVKKFVRDVNKKIIFFEGKDFSEKNYSRKEIENIFKEAKKNGTIVCIDAIDEISYDSHKQFIKEQLKNPAISCFITARKTEYTDENPEFITLHLDPMDMEEFLKSRFWEDEVKMQEVKTQLKSMNLYTEIQWNPLLLSFAYILASIGETKKEEYENFWIKSLENIQSKADLYESMSRMILVKHNDQKWTKLSKRDLTNNLAYLWEVAYNIHSNWSAEAIEIEDQDLQTLSIFKKSDKWGYDFIHNSFYEFFLARYLAGQSNGNEQICSVRNDNEQDWNKWREFKPVVLFYGEELVRNGKRKELENLLNWLLENDDMFGEGFFMGLEILYKLEWGWRLNEQMEKIKMKYVGIVKNWDKEEIIKKLPKFIEFQKRINFEENDFLDCFVNKITWDFIDKFYYKFIYLWNEKITKICLNKVGLLWIKYALNYLFETKNKKIIQEILSSIKKQEDALECLLGDDKSCKKWKNESFWSRKAELYNRVSRYIYLFRELHEIYIELIKTWNKKVIDYAKKFAIKFLKENKKNNTKKFQIFIELIQIWEIEYVFNIAKEYDFIWIMPLYIELIKTWNKEVIDYVIKNNIQLERTEKKDFELYLRCLLLIKTWNQEIIDYIKHFALKLEEKWEIRAAYEIYIHLIESWNQSHMKAVFGFLWRCKNEFDESDVLDAYVWLSIHGCSEAINQVIIHAHKYEKDRYLYGACDLYIKLIPTWDPPAIEKISSCFYEYLKEENKDRWSNSSNSIHLCEKLVATWNGEVIKQVLYFIEKLKEDGKISWYLYSKLFPILNPKPLKEPLQKWNTEDTNQFLQFIKKREDELYAAIDKEKRPYNPEEDYSEDFWGYPVSERDICYSFDKILNLYIELIEVWSQEAIWWARGLIQRSIQVWELDVTIELVERLKEVTKKISM